MKEEVGKITNIVNGRAYVQMESGSQCNRCGANHSCTPLNQITRELEIPVSNENIKIGDRVSINFRPQTRILSAVLVFILPVIFLITGYFIGTKFYNSEDKSILTGFTGLSISFIIILS